MPLDPLDFPAGPTGPANSTTTDYLSSGSPFWSRFKWDPGVTFSNWAEVVDKLPDNNTNFITAQAVRDPLWTLWNLVGYAIDLAEGLPLGATGSQGLQGFQGRQGHQGFRGHQGFDGIQGGQGRQGRQGIQGNQGRQGFIGVQGLQGFQGIGFQGSQGVSATGIQGLQGFQGRQGNQGLIGYQGNQGNVGTIGLPGIGITGVQGHQGLIGFQGFTGLQGEVGPTGATFWGGPTGDQGFQGHLGSTGFQGNQGHTGNQGNQGLIGFQGFTGLQGEVGPTGATFWGGPTGDQGFQGYMGPTGATFWGGPTGFQGLQGNQGFQGFQGITGYQGNQGFGLQGGTGMNAFTYTITTGNTVPPCGETFSLAVQNSSWASIGQIIYIGPYYGYHLVVGPTPSTSVDPDVLQLVNLCYPGNPTQSTPVPVDSTVSPAGLIGATGFQGRQGIAGEFAGIGSTGFQGFQGLTGNQGLQGLQGLQGFQGVQGQGVQGVTGTIGSTGIQGIQGITGLQGPFGGPQGEVGPTGSSFTGRQLWVDSVFGDDSTGLPERFDFPYLTLYAAQVDAVSGDVINVRPGTYSNDYMLGKDGVDWYFSDGIVVKCSSVGMTAIDGHNWLFGDYSRESATFSEMSYNVSGFANLIAPSDSTSINSVLYFRSARSDVHFNDLFMYLDETLVGNTIAMGNPIILDSLGDSYRWSKDRSFNVGIGASSSAEIIMMDPDGQRIYVGGQFEYFNDSYLGDNPDGYQYPSLVRLQKDGSRDFKFNEVLDEYYYYLSGATQSGPPIGTMMVDDTDNSILFGINWISTNSQLDQSLSKFTQNDEKAIGFTYSTVGSLTLQSSTFLDIDQYGYYIMGGTRNTTSGTRIQIVNPNSGTSSTMFFFKPTSYVSTYDRIVGGIRNDGNLIVAGGFTGSTGTHSSNKLMEFSYDGAQWPPYVLSRTFESGFGFGPVNSVIRCLLVLDDDSMILGGRFTEYDGVPIAYNLIKLNSDYTINSTFNSNLGSGFTGSDTSGAIECLKLDNQGNLLVGGRFTQFDGDVNCRYMVKLDIDGNLLDDFNSLGSSLGSFNDTVSTIEVQQDNRILVGGFFTLFNGELSRRIIRLGQSTSIHLHQCVIESFSERRSILGTFSEIPSVIYSYDSYINNGYENVDMFGTITIDVNQSVPYLEIRNIERSRPQDLLNNQILIRDSDGRVRYAQSVDVVGTYSSGSGASLGITYYYDAASLLPTNVSPIIRFNSSAASTTTEIYITHNDFDSVSQIDWIMSMGGLIYAFGSKNSIFKIVSVADGGTYKIINVSYLSGDLPLSAEYIKILTGIDTTYKNSITISSNSGYYLSTSGYYYGNDVSIGSSQSGGWNNTYWDAFDVNDPIDIKYENMNSGFFIINDIGTNETIQFSGLCWNPGAFSFNTLYFGISYLNVYSELSLYSPGQLVPTNSLISSSTPFSDSQMAKWVYNWTPISYLYGTETIFFVYFKDDVLNGLATNFSYSIKKVRN